MGLVGQNPLLLSSAKVVFGDALSESVEFVADDFRVKISIHDLHFVFADCF